MASLEGMVILPYGVPIRVAGCFEIQLSQFDHAAHHVRYNKIGVIEHNFNNLSAWFRLEDKDIKKTKAVIYLMNTTSFENIALSIQDLDFPDNCGYIVSAPLVDGTFTPLPEEFSMCNPENDCTTTSTPAPINNPPVAVADSIETVMMGQTIQVDILANDTDLDGDVLTIKSVNSSTYGIASIVDNKIQFTATNDYIGIVTIEYTITDGTSDVTSTLQIEVTEAISINNPPVAVADTINTVTSGYATSINVISNDTDADGDTITIKEITSVTNGSASISIDKKTIHFDAPSYYMGIVTIEYIITDGISDVVTTLQIEVVEDLTLMINNPPVVVADIVAPITSGDTIAVDVLSNDTDLDGDALTITSINNVIGGTASILNNTIQFVSEDTYIGTATIGYTITDGTDTVTGTLSIEVVDTLIHSTITVGADTLTDNTIASKWDMLANFNTYGLTTPEDISLLINENGNTLNVVNTQAIPNNPDNEIRFTTVAGVSTGLSANLSITDTHSWGANAYIVIETFDNTGSSINRVELTTGTVPDTVIYKEFTAGAETLSEVDLISKDITYDVSYANTGDYTVFTVSHLNSEIMPEFTINSMIVKYT